MDQRCGREFLRSISRLDFVNPKPGLWKAAMVVALGASIWASVPLFHRFGTLCGALIVILTMYAYLLVSLSCSAPTAACSCSIWWLHRSWLFQQERILLLVVLGVLAVLHVALLQIMVPHDTGLLNSAALLTTFVVTVTVIVAS